MFVEFEKPKQRYGEKEIGFSKQGFYFGKFNPGERLQIEYDKDKAAVRFTQAKDSPNYKVTRSGRAYILSAHGFVRANLLPFGRYRQVDKMTYQLKTKGVK